MRDGANLVALLLDFVDLARPKFMLCIRKSSCYAMHPSCGLVAMKLPNQGKKVLSYAWRVQLLVRADSTRQSSSLLDIGWSMRHSDIEMERATRILLLTPE